MLRNFRDFFPLGQFGRGKLLALTLFSSPLFRRGWKGGKTPLAFLHVEEGPPFFGSCFGWQPKKEEKRRNYRCTFPSSFFFAAEGGKKGWSSVGTARVYKEVLGETAEEGREIYAAAGDTRKGKKGIFGWKGGK